MIECFTQRELPDRSAWVGSTVAHWGYGSLAEEPTVSWSIAAPTAGAVRRPLRRRGLGRQYIVLPQAGLYEPIWKYDARTLAWDLGAHLAYGAGTGAVFWLLATLPSGGRGRRP